MIDVNYIKPNPKLLQYVRKISVFKSKQKIKYKHKLTPSAFTYLSYNHKDIPISFFGNKKVHPTGRLQIAGPKINEKIYVEYNGWLSQILVEFTASGFYYLFHHSPGKLTNRLTEVSNFVLPDVYIRLEKQLGNLSNVEEQLIILEDFLIEKSYNVLPFIDYIEEGSKIIEEHNGSINISDLLKDLNISERQFNRKFREIIGISPKCYSKILQLHYVIKLMYSGKNISPQELTYQAEFYDLPHFANRFKELTGFTPNEFIKSDQHIARKYFTDLIK